MWNGAHPLRFRRNDILFYVPLYNTTYRNDLSGLGYTGLVYQAAHAIADGPPVAPLSFDMGSIFSPAVAGLAALELNLSNFITVVTP